ncbi:MAG: class I SAM-dependent methyltransferase [Phycisphaerae bacterium]|nr:class I SAM-dependent methyltransferase [Phycisphaerae bacterium]
MTPKTNAITRRHGKPFNYFQLGKGFRQGADFMRHMKASAERLLSEATRAGAIRAVTRCPICGNDDTDEQFEVFGFPYRQCDRDDCGHVFVATLIDGTFRDEFFRDDDEYSRRNYCDPTKSAFRLENVARPKVDHVLRFAPHGASSWLDVGCGSGEILAVLKEVGGWDGVGLELSGQDATFGRDHYGVDIREQLLADFRAHSPDARFDVVSLFGVVDCLEDPVALVRESAQVVRPGGLLVTEDTNYDSVVTRAVRSYPRHPTRSNFNGVTTVHQFNERSIRRTFAAAGVEPIAVWYFGTDVFEVINQWCFADETFADSPLAEALSDLANDIQAAIDARQQSSNMLWVARKPG